MPMSIPEYAKLRGVTTTGVYKALERHPEIEEHTHKGTVNGKAAKILEDDAVGLLDQVMRMPKQDNSLITAEIAAPYQEEIDKLKERVYDAQERAYNEATKTREEALIAVRGAVKDALTASNEDIKAQFEPLATTKEVQDCMVELKDNMATHYRILELENQVEMLEREKRALQETVQELKSDLEAERAKSIMQRLFGKG